MRVFGHLFGHRDKKELPGLLPAIERAVLAVEPLLKQIGGYPDSYRKPVAVALEYARSLAASLPGPVMINRESYAMDALYMHFFHPSIRSGKRSAPVQHCGTTSATSLPAMSCMP